MSWLDAFVIWQQRRRLSLRFVDTILDGICVYDLWICLWIVAEIKLAWIVGNIIQLSYGDHSCWVHKLIWDVTNMISLSVHYENCHLKLKSWRTTALKCLVCSWCSEWITVCLCCIVLTYSLFGMIRFLNLSYVSTDDKRSTVVYDLDMYVHLILIWLVCRHVIVWYVGM